MSDEKLRKAVEFAIDLLKAYHVPTQDSYRKRCEWCDPKNGRWPCEHIEIIEELETALGEPQ